MPLDCRGGARFFWSWPGSLVVPGAGVVAGPTRTLDASGLVLQVVCLGPAHWHQVESMRPVWCCNPVSRQFSCA